MIRRLRAWRHRRWLWLLPGSAVVMVAALLVLAWPRSSLTQPEGSYRLLDRHGHWLADIDGPAAGEYGYWPLASVPERVAVATLALEDARFEAHPGVDPLAVMRAVGQNLRCGCVRSGASTLAMQTVRLQRPARRSLWNKAVEAVAAVLMTTRHGRDAVLRQYLRLVPYGNGSHGIAHAARLYLDKPVEDLSWAEIALLSAIPRAPDRNNPLTVAGHANAVARAERILDHLKAEGVLDGAGHDLAQRQLRHLRLRPMPHRDAAHLHAVMALSDQLRAQRQPSGTVQTLLDGELQARAASHAQEWLSRHVGQGVQQAAVMVVDRETMAVRALIGSGDYFDPQGGALDYSNIARSPGSVIKPLIYALALDRGEIEPDSVLLDAPLEVPGVRNADRRYLGPMLPRQALANSRNVPAVALVQALGVSRTFAFLERLGLHEETRPASYFGPGIAIGTLPTRLRDVVQAYGVLANDGRMQPLRWHRGEPGQEPEALLGSASSRLISQFLSDPMARLPSFRRMGALEYDFPVAVKTGTSQAVRDAWAVAYSRRFIVGVWAGRADGQPMQAVRGASAAELTHAVLAEAENHEQAWQLAEAFPKPRGYRLADVCPANGSTDTTGCSRVVGEWLPETRQRPAGWTLAARGDGWSAPAGSLTLATPSDGAVYYRNPELPEELQTLRFALRRPPAGEVVWHVDGQPYAVLAADQPLHLPMQAGSVQVYAQRAFRPERTAMVSVTVR